MPHTGPAKQADWRVFRLSRPALRTIRKRFPLGQKLAPDMHETRLAKRHGKGLLRFCPELAICIYSAISIYSFTGVAMLASTLRLFPIQSQTRRGHLHEDKRP